MRLKIFVGIMILMVVTAVTMPVLAQTPEPTPDPDAPTEPIPQVHTVVEGENLTSIATLYDVTIEELLVLNGLDENDFLSVGQTLIIPGGEGEAVTTVYTVQAGDTLQQVAAVFDTTPADVLATNQIINQAYEPVVGQTLNVVSRTGSALPQPVTGTPHVVALGESLAMIAARYNVSPAVLAAANELTYPYYLFPGQRLRIPGEAEYRYLPGEWTAVSIRPLIPSQGDTVSIYVENLLDGRPSGFFAGQPLRFFPHESGYAALVGIDAFTEPGLYTLELGGSGNRPWRPFSQRVQIESGNYGLQEIIVSEELSGLLDPELRQREDAFLDTFYTTFNDTQQWEGLFQVPVTTTIVTAPYGDARSYNGGPVEIYHTGVDFAGTTGTPILAPNAGTVLFADSLELRGNTIIIDHGLGVMSAYFHLSEMLVAEGDVVSIGQPIGAGGSTGLSTGPHLHWDLQVQGVPVDGLQWTQTLFP